MPLDKAHHLKTLSTTPVWQQAALYVSLMLAGCVTNRPLHAPAPTILPDGSSGFTLHCVGHGDNSDCEAQAVKACGGLYTVISPAQGSEVANSLPVGQRAGGVLVVKCLPP